MDYPCVVSRQLPKLHAHRHNSAGVCLRMCYGCVSMLCWCVQGCCGLNRFSVSCLGKTPAQLYCTHKRAKACQKAHIRNNPAYVGLSARARVRVHNLHQSSPAAEKPTNVCYHTYLRAQSANSTLHDMEAANRLSHKHIHIFPNLLVRISWCARCVTEELEANARQGERDGRMHPLLCFEWTGPHRRPLGAPSSLHHLSVSHAPLCLSLFSHLIRCLALVPLFFWFHCFFYSPSLFLFM